MFLYGIFVTDEAPFNSGTVPQTYESSLFECGRGCLYWGLTNVSGLSDLSSLTYLTYLTYLIGWAPEVSSQRLYYDNFTSICLTSAGNVGRVLRERLSFEVIFRVIY